MKRKGGGSVKRKMRRRPLRPGRLLCVLLLVLICAFVLLPIILTFL